MPDGTGPVPGADSLTWRCPNHGTPISPGWPFTCADGCSYPVVNGTPRFVPDDDYAASFGRQWNRWPTAQLDSQSGSPISRNRLVATLGRDVFDALHGAAVLEAGCGAGRFTEVLLAQGAFVCSVDLSSAVDANAQNCTPSSQHVVVQADALRLPLAPRQFDLVVALGMVQHTPDPEETMAALARHVRPGGWLVVDHYATGVVHRIRLARLYRASLVKMDPEQALERVTRFYDTWAPRHRRARSRAVRMGLVIVSPIVYFGDEWPQLDEAQRREWSILDTYDSLTDQYKHRRSVDEVHAVFETLGLEDIATWMQGNVVAARGRAPLRTRRTSPVSVADC